MKEFNLERWLRTGEELVTRGGVKVLCTKYFENNAAFCKLKSMLADGSNISHYTDGDYTKSSSEEQLDLYFANDIEPKPQPKRGDTVWVRDNENDCWHKRIFLVEMKDCNSPFIVTEKDSEYLRNPDAYMQFYFTCWKEVRTTDPALDKPKIEITVKVNGKEVKLSTLSDESILAIKNAAK